MQNITAELGVYITLLTIVFSAGGFYMMGLFNGKKVDRLSDDVTDIKKTVNQLNIDVRSGISDIKTDVAVLSQRVTAIEHKTK